MLAGFELLGLDLNGSCAFGADSVSKVCAFCCFGVGRVRRGGCSFHIWFRTLDPKTSKPKAWNGDP